MRNFNKPTLLAFSIAILLSQQVWAEDAPNVALEGMKIELAKQPKTKTGETTVTRQQLNQENIQNSHDLVRYNTEVDVAEVGRYGNKGFAIRGVDGNRVAMSVDGVALPEVESNEIYSPYGYNYEGRFNPDMEMLGSVRVVAGADSLISGSGAVGGAISYKTKEPSQLVKKGNLGGYAKVGYTNKNEELLTAVGLAGSYDRAEFLLNYARREGHELKNHDMKKHNEERLKLGYNFKANKEEGYTGRSNRPTSLLYPEASNHQQDSVLAKFYYHLNDSHRLGLSGVYQNRKYHSYLYSKNPFSRERMADDVEKMTGYGINYRFLPTASRWLDRFETNYQYQDVQGIANTTLYRQSFGSTTYEWEETKLRPVRTQNHQIKVDTLFTVMDWGRFGSHQFALTGNYSKQDFSQSKPTLTKYEAAQGDDIVWTDAKKDIYSLIFSDNISFTDRLKANLGVRYDYYKYSPYFQDDVWFDKETTKEQDVIDKALKYSSLRLYEQYKAGFYDKKISFDNVSYHGAFDYQVIPNRLTARYKVGTGFLAPNITQVYSSFQGQGLMQITNPDLKPETSLNQELEFEFRPTKNTMLTLASYVSKYDDFIHAKYWGPIPRDGKPINGCKHGNGLCMQYQNLDSAEVKGLKVGVETDLSDKLNTKGKFSMFANYHTAKDSAIVETDHDGRLKINTLAATPTSLILGADYVSANKDWSLHGRIRGLMAKKVADTKSIDVKHNYNDKPVSGRYYNSSEDACTGASGWSTGYTWNGTSCVEKAYAGYTEYVKTYDVANRSKNVVIYDLYGTKKFGKSGNVILNAGVYNIGDVKYIPWETLRQFANPNANSLVDNESNGFNRYTAPGRNYAVSLTYEF